MSMASKGRRTLPEQIADIAIATLSSIASIRE
jgi:hypothetical protein